MIGGSRRSRWSAVCAVAAAAFTFALSSPSTAAACGGAAWAPPLGLWFGPVSDSGQGVFGSPGYGQHYSYGTAGNVPTPVAVEVRGYDSAQNEQWYSIGLGGKNGSGTVPWGNVLSSAALKARSLSINGVTVYWSC